jgi:hypothetical protein
MVGGSVGRGAHEEESDIDLFVFSSSEPHYQYLLTHMNRVAGLMGKIIGFRGPTWIDTFGYSFTALYDDLFVCQINLTDAATLPATPMRGLPGMMLFDRGKRYETALRRRAILPDERATFSSAATLFWLRALFASRELQRGGLWMAIQYLSEMRDQLLVLLRLVNSQPPEGLNYRTSAKAIERDIRDAGTALAPSLPHYNTRAIASAIRFCMRTFMQQSHRLARKCEVRPELKLGLKVYSHVLRVLAQHAVSARK